MNDTKKREYKILILEDNPADAELIERELRKGVLEFVSKIVATKEDFSNALDNFVPDIILADYKLQSFDGLEALGICKIKCPFCPFILVTGIMKEEDAATALDLGVADYIFKDNLIRLEPAVKRILLDQTTKADVHEESQDIKRMNKFMVNREVKMVELKKEIQDLKKRLDEK